MYLLGSSMKSVPVVKSCKRWDKNFLLRTRLGLITNISIDYLLCRGHEYPVRVCENCFIKITEEEKTPLANFFDIR